MMIPSSIQRGGRGGRSNIPLPMVIVGGIGLVLVCLFAWVALSMGSVPTTEPVTADVPVKL